MWVDFSKQKTSWNSKGFWLGAILLLTSCATSSSQSLLLNLPYSEARKIILLNGWQPVSVERNYDDEHNISRFLKLGYVEVDTCSGTGKGYCRFVFQNDAGLFMEVTTQEIPLRREGKTAVATEGEDFVINYGITDEQNR